MNNLVEVKIQNMIYEIRGKQVMLDSDLAKLYGCKNGTKSINLAVKRHINRFPERFVFQLTNEEFNNLKFRIETSSLNDYGGIRKLPYAFTEQGVAMLSAVLRTDVAEGVSVAIMDAFVAMRHFISKDLLNSKYVNSMLVNHEERIKLIENTFDKFKTNNNHIFFEGQIYDAYSLILDIFENSKNEIIIIDNYVDKKLLDLLSKTKKKIKVYSKNMNKELIKKYQSQYDNVEVIENDMFHDRFIIIDQKELYHCGASFKELGKKCFGINRVYDINILNKILEQLKKATLVTSNLKW